MALAKTELMIITNPEDTFDNTGIYLKHRLKITDMQTHVAIAFDSFATGKTIAINMPYMAIPKDVEIIIGIASPTQAPINVPILHPNHGVNISPYR